MEVILIHKPMGTLPPEMLTAGMELTQKVMAKPEEFVPGGKLIAAYFARSLWLAVCIWEVPTVEALMPFLEQTNMLGWNNEVIPAEKADVAIEKATKALEALTAKK